MRSIAQSSVFVLSHSVRARSAVPDLGDAVGIDGQLKRGRPLGAERAAADGAFRVALDVDDLACPDADELAAADGAVRTDAGHFFAVGDFQAADMRLRRSQVDAEAEQPAEREATRRRGPEELSPGHHGSLSE